MEFMMALKIPVQNVPKIIQPEEKVLDPLKNVQVRNLKSGQPQLFRIIMLVCRKQLYSKNGIAVKIILCFC